MPVMGTDAAAPGPLAYDDELRQAVRARLGVHDRRVSDLTGRKAAAVAIVLVDSTVGEDPTDPHPQPPGVMDVVPGDTSGLDGNMYDVAGGAAFLLCRRAGRLRKHAGQWALPGGRLDPGETPVEAALRELHEELGVDLPASSVLGLMDDYETRSGYVMTPVVVWGGGRLDLDPSPDEVLATYRIGLHHLLAPGTPRFVTIPQSDRPVVQVPLGRDLLHAPTAAVLVQLAWLGLQGRPDPVAHFEQPVFAWK